MATRVVKPQRDEETMLTGWESMPEQAPSLVREDQPTFARIVAMVGVLLLAVGAMAMVAPVMRWTYVISSAWGLFVFTLGLAQVLYHAFVDRDVQFRRIYLAVGMFLLLFGVGSAILRVAATGPNLFLPYGAAGLLLALLFLLAVLRSETDQGIRRFILRIFGILGWGMIVVAAIGGQVSADFLLREGILLFLLGIAYVCSCIGMVDIASELSFKMGLALGIFGAGLFVISLGRSLLPVLFTNAPDFFVPAGLILTTASLICIAISLGICSDLPLIVLTRREIAAVFYSPIGYLVLFGMMLIGWLMFYVFVDQIETLGPRGALFEPIVSRFIFSIIPVFGQMFVIPILTMRLLSEEHRTGSLEMLLTAPVNEITVVLAKFLAVLIFYLLTWLGWWLFLIALRVGGGQEFDYRPILSFMFAAIATGSGFLAMGLFFSSLTKNQIIAAVLTSAGMMFHLSTFMIRNSQGIGPVWRDVLGYISYIDLWFATLDGVVAPRYFMFHLSAAVFFLYMTVKVLESRKWK